MSMWVVRAGGLARELASLGRREMMVAAGRWARAVEPQVRGIGRFWGAVW